MKKNKNNKFNMPNIKLLGKLVFAMLALSLVSCHATIGTPSGIREYHRGINGLVAEGKSAPNVETSYWQTQKQYDGLNLGGN